MARKWTDKQLIEVVRISNSIANILRTLNLKLSGGNYQLIQCKIADLNIDVSHLTGQGWLKGKSNKNTIIQKNRPIEICMVENGRPSDRQRIKRYLLESRPYKCEICGLNSWLNEPITLQMDHINGVCAAY